MARIVELLADWLLPLRCRICAQSGDQGMDLCAACQRAAVANQQACPGCALPLPGGEQARCARCQKQAGLLAACHAGWRYGPTLDALVRRYKFEQDLAAGAVLAGLMLQQRPAWLAGQVLVPVPLHRQRLARRGFDQAYELAGLLAQGTGLARRELLLRKRATAAQSGLDQAQRQRNLRGAFSVRPGALPSQVVLIDDVMTTGATLEAAAQTLRRAGVEQVRAWVAARTV